MNKNLLKLYNDLTDCGTINKDAAQIAILERLTDLKAQVEAYDALKNAGFLAKLFSKNKVQIPQGIYIYGEVGRGKSMLADLFFDNLQIKRKKRVHFHAFMQDVHSFMYKYRRQENKKTDPIVAFADKLAKQVTLLCFDEFQVADIADAMILGRLFGELFDRGVVVVATSNRIPDDLYKDGLQRESFLPFIALLKQKTHVCMLNSNEDYRLSHLKSMATMYMSPLGKKSDEFLKRAFAELANNAAPEIRVLEIKGRKLIIDKTHGDIAWIGFAQLCDTALGAIDYIEIASEFSTILLADIPQMDRNMRNEAKRFVTLVDELYEHKVNLICTAEVPAVQLYESGDGSFEFERTASRLIEMQSEQYLQLAHVSG